MRRLILWPFACWSFVPAILLNVSPAFGLDGIRLAGTADKLQLELTDATVRDTLAALQSAFDLKCRCPPALNRRVTGVYQGNIGRILSRLLDGYDFVIKTSPSGAIEVIIPGAEAPAIPTQASPYRSPDAPSLAARDAMRSDILQSLQEQRQRKGTAR